MSINFSKWLVVVLLLVGAFAATAVMSPIYTFTFIPVICFGAILIGNPRIYIYIYLTVASIYPLIQSITAFAPFKYLNEIMAIVIYLMFFGHLVLRRLNPSKMRKFFQLCLFFLGYCLLNWLINRGIPKGLLQFFFIYVPFIPLFFLVREYFTDRDFGILLKWTIGFFWLNFALNLGWWFRINPFPNEFTFVGNMTDHAIGTMGGCNYIAYFCCMLIFLLLAVLVKSSKRTRGKNKFINITLLAAFAQLYMTFTNHAYVFFIMTLVPFAYLTRLWKKWYIMVVMVITGTVFFVVASQSERANQVFNKKDLQHRYEQLAYSPKIKLYKDLLIENLQENPGEWFIGVGPGNGMGHIGMDNQTPFALRMLLEYYQASNMRQMQLTSITGNTYSVVFSIWGDLGVVGFVLFSLIHILTLIYCYEKIRTGSAREVAVAQFLLASFILWVIIGLVVDGLQTVIPIWLWVWVGWLFRKKTSSTVEIRPIDEAIAIDDAGVSRLD